MIKGRGGMEVGRQLKRNGGERRMEGGKEGGGKGKRKGVGREGWREDMSKSKGEKGEDSDGKRN